VCFVVVVVVFTTCHIDKYGKHFEHSMILQSSSIFVIFIEHAKIQRGGAKKQHQQNNTPDPQKLSKFPAPLM
jgi:hypothetical protein